MALSILVADDSSTVRSIVTRTISMAGIPVGLIFSASNGSEALDVLRREWIDLMFLDINMPVVDGLSVVEIMAQDEVLKTVPVIVISSDVSPGKIIRLKKAGVKAFVKKPFTPEMIRDVITNVVGGSGA